MLMLMYNSVPKDVPSVSYKVAGELKPGLYPPGVKSEVDKCLTKLIMIAGDSCAIPP